MTTIKWTPKLFNQSPSWMQDNDFIIDGYRPPGLDLKMTFHSVFRLHNQTGSIWTHLVGAIIYVILTAYFVSCNPSLFTPLQVGFMVMYYTSAIIALSFSTVYHTFSHHSHEVSTFLIKLDYIGIVILITGSNIPWFYYAFKESFLSKHIYITLAEYPVFWCEKILLKSKNYRPKEIDSLIIL